MDHCDVLIVGGGPAGSTLAWKLRQHGLDAVVLDKSVFPRHKVCAGWITPATVELLQLDRDEYARGRVLQQITGFRTCMLGGSEIVTRYPHTVSYGILRPEFDHYLLLRSGARARLGEPLMSLERDGRGWVVNGDVRTSLIVGAGGHFCPVARRLRGRDTRVRREPVVLAQEVEFKLNASQQRECPVADDTPELYFCGDLKGYGWCIRKGDHLNIGLGREDAQSLAEQVRAFLGFLKERRRVPADSPEKFLGHAYRLYQGASADLVENGVMLIGDAAGLASPRSGEGIRPAVESALTASDVILSAAGDHRRRVLIRYPVLLAHVLGKAGRAPRLLPGSMKRLVGRRLMGSSWFSRRVVLDRWFLRSSTG
jgi:flavin-dependent dehydrogenase